MQESRKYKTRSIAFFIMFMVAAVTYDCYGQEKQGSVSIGLGLGTNVLTTSGIGAQSSVHSNLNVRKMFTNKIGVFGALQMDGIVSERDTDYRDVYKYAAGSILGGISINTGRVLNIEELSPNITVINSFGGGVTRFAENLPHLENLNATTISFSTEVMYRLGQRTSLTLKHTRLGFIDLENSFDAKCNIKTGGVSSFLDSFSIGLTGHLFRGGDKDHLDWYVEDDKAELAALQESFLNIKHPEVKDPISYTIELVDDKLAGEIYFTEGSAEIGIYALDKLQETANYLKANQSTKIDLVGFACTTHGSDAHNLKLSQERAESVFTKLESMGVDSSRMKFSGQGKDKRYVGKYNSDLAKRVEIRVIE